MNTSELPIATGWVHPPTSITGQDHLALRAVSEAIYAELVPCVTNVTDRIRLYAFYPWFTWTFSHEMPGANYDEYVRLFRRAECLFTMIGSRHEAHDEAGRVALHGEGSPGRRKLHAAVRELGGETIRLSTFADRSASEAQWYFRAELGGFDQYYRGTLQTLDIMGGTRHGGIKVTPNRGVRLARVFDSGVSGSLFWRTIQEDAVTAERLDELAPFCPCFLETHDEERREIVDILLNRDGVKGTPHMRDAFRLVCDFLSETVESSEDRDGLVWRFRESVYGGVLPTRMWSDPAITTWAGYQRHELMSMAVQSIFWAVFRRIEEANAIGRLPTLYSSGEVARWFLQSEGAHLSDIDLTQTFELFVDSAAGALPLITAITDPSHELTMAEDLRTDEAISSVVTKACRLLAMLVARQGDTPPYGSFAREESYFQDYPVNLRSLRSLSRGRWKTLSVREWILWLIAHWAVGNHLGVALRKLHAQGLDTFRLRPTDLGLLPVQNIEVVYSRPRLHQTLRALRDLGFLDDSHRLTDLGQALRRELHG